MNELHRYEIGGVCVQMTEAQADRWNSGDMTEQDEREATVTIPTRVGCRSCVRNGEVVVEDGLPTSHTMSLAEALRDLDAAQMMNGCVASRIAD